METKRQTHQREERALCVRVIEAEERRDAAVEAMNKECMMRTSLL